VSLAQIFPTSYLKTSSKTAEEMFLSVTENFIHGPGIIRDGITAPRMRDPHTVAAATEGIMHPDSERELPLTKDPYVQRAGTWTLFQHAKKFVEEHGAEYLLIGVQSCGDLTMNLWHVALIKTKTGPLLCCLQSEGDKEKEDFHSRYYRCLVKWNRDLCPYLYEFIDLKFSELRHGYQTAIVDEEYKSNRGDWLNKRGIDPHNITNHVEFALSGKPIIQKGHEIGLANVIDRFQDVRHIFNVPTVKTRTLTGSPSTESIQFGEHILFNDLNARRAALYAPIIVELQIPDAGLIADFGDLERVFAAKHYRRVEESPTQRACYRRYSESSIEIFYPHNVYPFGVLGGKAGEVVCLSSGGLSGRVGNTLEGITRMMYDFFGCEDAMVLDEGYDTFQVINPNPKVKEDEPDRYKYDNDEMLREITKFVLWRAAQDDEESEAYQELQGDEYKFGSRLKNWPLNKRLFDELRDYAREMNVPTSTPDTLDVMVVEPNRSQMRAVMIFAVKKERLGKKPASDEQNLSVKESSRH